MQNKVRGRLVIIGGAEDRTGECLKEVVRLAGGRSARVVIITTATEKQQATGRKYIEVFRDLDVAEAWALDLDDRQKANDQVSCQSIHEATALFLTGGDQLRITSILGGTRAYDAIQRGYREGLVVAGTSAGASAMSGAMITSGLEDNSPKDMSTRLAPGLGLLEEVVVDQHFAQRGRLGRLLSVIAQNPAILGLGIDENTAVSVGSDSIMSVIGTGAVTVVDGTSIEQSNVSDTGVSRTLFLSNVVLHVLPSGYGYDLRSRQPVVCDSRQSE